MFRFSEKKSKSGSHKRISKKFRKRVILRYMNNKSNSEEKSECDDFLPFHFSETKQ